MTLSINPLAKLVTSVSQQVSAASNAAQTSLQGEQFASLKQGVNDTVNRLSGGIGSGLNGSTSAINGALGDLSTATTALGGFGSSVQSLASNALSTASSVSGTVSNVGAQIGASLNKLGLGQGSLGSGLINAAAGISSAAGQINNLLSLARGKNLPSGAELFSKAGAFVEVEAGPGDDWRVKLDCNFGLFGDAFSRLDETGGMVWPYLPNITISTRANYSNIEPVHNNYPFMAYKNSQVEDIQIAGEFSVENAKDAEYWVQATTFLRTATKMFFGTGAFVGNPPVVCRLTGYGTRIFHNVPVVVKSFSVDLKEDVNYIKLEDKTGTPTWVPVMSTISATVAPIYNRTRLRQFDLNEFAAGKAVGFI